MVIFTRFTDRATDERGAVIYENEGVLFDRLVLGPVREHTSYADTQRTLGFDQRLGIAPQSAGPATPVMADGQ